MGFPIRWNIVSVSDRNEKFVPTKTDLCHPYPEDKATKAFTALPSLVLPK